MYRPAELWVRIWPEDYWIDWTAWLCSTIYMRNIAVFIKSNNCWYNVYFLSDLGKIPWKQWDPGHAFYWLHRSVQFCLTWLAVSCVRSIWLVLQYINLVTLTFCYVLESTSMPINLWLFWHCPRSTVTLSLSFYLIKFISSEATEAAWYVRVTSIDTKGDYAIRC